MIFLLMFLAAYAGYTLGRQKLQLDEDHYTNLLEKQKFELTTRLAKQIGKVP